MNRILNVVKKEFLQIRRDRRMLGITILAPLIQLIILGYAANLDVRNIPALICDMDNSTESRELVYSFESSEYFSITEYSRSTEGIDRMIETGKVSIALVIPENFSRDLKSTRQTAIQGIIDGSDASTVGISMNYASALIADYSKEVMLEKLNIKGQEINSEPVHMELRIWFNEGLRSRYFMIPGIIGILLMVVTLLLTAMAIVREKENGTLEQISVTPIRKSQFILGKLIPFTLIGFFDVLLVVFLGRFIFNVPLEGSITLLLLASLLFITSTLGLGLFVSTISETQKQAMLTVMFFLMMPMMYLSGFIFPIENMPDWIKSITYIIPLRYFLTIVRGIFLKGAGIAVLWQDFLLLLILGIIIFTVSVRRFRKRFD